MGVDAEFEKNGTAFITKVVQRGNRSRAIAIAKECAALLHLKVNQVIKIVIFRRKEDISK